MACTQMEQHQTYGCPISSTGEHCLFSVICSVQAPSGNIGKGRSSLLSLQIQRQFLPEGPLKRHSKIMLPASWSALGIEDLYNDEHTC